MLRHGKMKHYPLFLCCFRTPVIHSFFIIFALLFLSKSVVAMPYAHNASYYPACKDDAYVHAEADSYYGDSDYYWDYYINSWQPLTEKNRGIRKGLLHLASNKTLFDWNLARKDSLPLNGDGLSSIMSDAAAVGCDTPTRSYTIKNVATQGGSFDICEHDKQVPIKLSLLSVSMRARFSSIDVLGGAATEEFKEYDVAANFRLPWAWYSHSGWGVGMRMMASAGALYSDGETGLVVSLIPIVALGSQDGRFTLDMGAGGALLSRHRFGTQDFGGNFQFALTAGVGVPLFKQLGVGYRFLHYSDAGIYGPNNTGADFHMLELTYRF
jgi:hypothetical protein